MNIGICGGTFDPFHSGHLAPIRAARSVMRWDRVLYVPAYVQPFKQDRATASSWHRFAMTVLATEGEDGVFVSPLELERGTVSYTVDTLQQLRSEHPGATLDWIIGDDNLPQLLDWKAIDTIFALANFAVLTRMDSLPQDLPSVLASRVIEPQRRPAHGAISFAGNAVVPISSTEVRRRVQAGEPIDDLVPAAVSRYIQRYDLYREGHS